MKIGKSTDEIIIVKLNAEVIKPLWGNIFNEKHNHMVTQPPLDSYSKVTERFGTVRQPWVNTIVWN